MYQSSAPTDWIMTKDVVKEHFITNEELGITEENTYFIHEEKSDLYTYVEQKLRDSRITGKIK